MGKDGTPILTSRALFFTFNLKQLLKSLRLTRTKESHFELRTQKAQ